ncbi:enoyl-CoA hydratase-related protein [Sphingopyxis sp. 22461]|uniref:enoyl-CoA hydratase-related protein n=1 Tax=Sphingopyxis sp. 22461 TaxID=3453923 RepID=UPI003F87B1D1
MSDAILYALDGDVATITFNRPDRLNALTFDMIDDLSAKLDRVVEEGARCLLLTGNGRGFSTGADLQEMDLDAFARDIGQMFVEQLNPAFEKLANLPIPIVTAVNGPAAGAGCSLALYGDFVVAARSAYFYQSFANIGLVPDAGATWIIPRLIGLQRAGRMLLLGEKISADQACDWGMIHACVDDEELAGTARTLADRLAKGATTSYRLIRHGMRAALNQSFSETLAMEGLDQHAAAQTRDFREGVTSFRERRSPNFCGA